MAIGMGNEISNAQTPRRAEVDWTPLPVPWAVQTADRIPKQRYYDADFFQLEVERLWPRIRRLVGRAVGALSACMPARRHRPAR